MTACLLCIQPAGWRLPASSTQTLLHAAEEAGVALPSSCRNGTCRTCLCQLAEGKVRYEIAWPGLSAEEKAGGWVLPCVAYPLSDVTLVHTLARSIGAAPVPK